MRPYSLLFAVAAASAPCAQTDPAATRTALAQRLVADLDALQSHSRGLRTLPFTPQDLVARVGRDPEALLAWVRAHTAWVPYRGLLRGAEGTLCDGTGSSLDRAHLLAATLRVAGHEVRLARGTLSADAAGQAIQGFAARAAAPAADELPANPSRQDEDALALAAETSAALLAALSDAPAPPVEPTALAQDHWWVQQRVGDTWRDLDPSADAPGKALTAASATFPAQGNGFALPAAEAHTVGLRVVIEQVAAGARQEQVVLRAELRPADWFAQPLAVSFFAFDWPSGLQLDHSAEGRARFAQALLATKSWLPTLHLGRERVARASFDQHGIVDQAPALDGRSKLGRAVQRGFDALGGGEAAPEGLLTAVWLEFDALAPGSAPVRRRHELFDLLGPAARAANRLPKELGEAQRLDRALALLAETQVLLLGGDLPAGVVARRDVEARLDRRGRTRALLDIQDAGQFGNALRELAGEALSDSAAMTFAALRFGLALGPRRTFLASPNLALSRVQARWQADAPPRTARLLDLLLNRVAALPLGDAQQQRAAKVRQGVLDTVAEDLAVGNEPGSANNTAGLSARANMTLRALREPDLGAWPADSAARARAVLQSGAALFAPSDAGWWQVDAASGDTVGAMASGYHQGNNEYAETTTLTNPLLRARRLLEFVAKPGNRNLIFRARNGSRVPADLAREWEIISQMQARAAEVLYEAFGTLGL